MILFSNDNGFEYRIPSMVNAGGTLVAVCDNGRSGADWGYIELALRRSTDNGESWSEVKTLAAPPARSTSSDIENTKSAFFIDPCMTVAQNGDIILLVTFFPESKGVHNLKYLEAKKAAFTSFDGRNCSILYDKDDNYYIVLENGVILDGRKAKTPYTLKGLGELYKGEEYVGNVYLNGAQGKAEEGTKTSFGAPLKAPKRSFIFLMKSSDKGLTWTKPRDITPTILNEKDGAFIGVAPGRGITLKSGRIIMPLYNTKGSVCIYSDDDGISWQRNQGLPVTGNKGECCLIEAPSSRLYSYGTENGKIPETISFDNGIVWAKGDRLPYKSPKCQKSTAVIGERVFIAHPSGSKRTNGVISKGHFEYDKKGDFRGIKWQKKEIEITDGFFAYSCMAEIDSNTLGILYESKQSGEIRFEKIKVE